MLPQTERAPPRRRRASSATPSAAAADRGERSERGERGERAEQADAAIELGPLSRLLGYHVAQAAVVAYARFEQHLGKPFELRKVEFSLLMLLQANGALTPGQLARTLMLGAPTLSMLLDRLQARALLRREPNPHDGRSQHIVLTTKGRRLAQACAEAAEPMERELQERLSPAEHALLIELLARVAGQGPAR